MERYLNESDNMKVKIAELELLLGPEDSEVDLRNILMKARRNKGLRIFQIFSSQGPSDFLVVNTLRWRRRKEEQRRREEEYVEHLGKTRSMSRTHKVIKYMRERQEKVLAMLERKKSFLS